MTSDQVFSVAVIGGLSGVIGLVAVAGLLYGLYLALGHLVDLREARRARRRDLAACRAIDALGTTNHPKGNR